MSFFKSQQKAENIPKKNKKAPRLKRGAFLFKFSFRGLCKIQEAYQAALVLQDRSPGFCRLPVR